MIQPAALLRRPPRAAASRSSPACRTRCSRTSAPTSHDHAAERPRHRRERGRGGRPRGRVTTWPPAGPAVVYLQNSGLGNTVNPLISLADPPSTRSRCCSCIGWRGEPGVTDEPQHVAQGASCRELLEAARARARRPRRRHETFRTRRRALGQRSPTRRRMRAARPQGHLRALRLEAAVLTDPGSSERRRVERSLACAVDRPISSSRPPA